MTQGLLILSLLTLVLVSPFLTMIMTADALSYAPTLGPKRPYFYDLNGKRLSAVIEGTQVTVATTFTNYKEEQVPFVGILEVRDTDGVTVLLAWQSTTVEPLGIKTIGVSWVVPESSAYQSRAFAFTNFEHPQVLSVVESVEISAPSLT